MNMVKEVIVSEVERLDEHHLQKLLDFIKKLSQSSTHQQWTIDYQTKVLGGWQGELERPLNLPFEIREQW
jgi:hypothetical protein